MKLLNKSNKYISISILCIVTLWAAGFYITIFSEIKSSIDEGLENYKRLIILNAKKDSSILSKTYFDESFFTIEQIPKDYALTVRDTYVDTLLYMQDADDQELELEPVRLLISAFEQNGKYYKLKVANSMVEEDDLIDALFWNVIWLYVVVISGIVIINNLVIKKLWKPFYDFLNQLKSFRLGNTDRLPEISTDVKEFEDLYTAVDALLKDNISTYNQQKQFIGNASHELQTPLAITINKLELLLENGSLNSNQASEIAEVMYIIERLVRLNKSLLLLTKIENKQFLNNRDISITTITRNALNELQETASFKKINIHFEKDKELTTKMDESLAQILISNILRNAVFHNLRCGDVWIYIENESLTVKNTGINTQLNQNLLFSRFYKLNSSSKGSGLGLSIAKAIADLYGFKMSYTYDNSVHSFSIKF